MLLIEFIDGPEEAAGDEVEIARIGAGFVVVADGGGEDAGFVVVGVGPGDDEIVFALFSSGEGVGGGQEMAGGVVVEFFIDGGPVLHTFGDGGVGIDEGDGDGELGAVAGGLEAGEFEPGGDIGERRRAVAVHGAVEENGGFAG